MSCGACKCQVDHEWLAKRNAALAPHLATADLVLAPSASAARVFAANGVPASKLRVDENGLSATSTKSARRSGSSGDGSLRLMYAGGPDPLKGSHVIQCAARQLADLTGWSLDLYGIADTGAAGLPPQVRLRSPFLPEALEEVLAGHDVLVLPSIARESHSILTREALSAGLAVVCSDAPGPEEAVDHGRNGFVVPAGGRRRTRSVTAASHCGSGGGARHDGPRFRLADPCP